MTNRPKPKILIVDDNPSNLAVLSELLDGAGMEVFYAKEGEAALRRFALVEPDLVLLDIMMPGMDGYAVCRALQETPLGRCTPVIFMSALTETADKLQGFAAGAADYVTKPFHQEEVLARVNTHLKLHFMQEELQHKNAMLQRREEELRQEKEKAEELLLNILPHSIAERLKRGENPLADAFQETTVLFCDIVNFTDFAAGVNAGELVVRLSEIFEEFDLLAEQHGLEKIKTIGDAYMLVGGLPDPRADHASAVADIALEMLEVMSRLNRQHVPTLEVRIGIHSGPVVAGVIGRKRFIYDLWGDTVNVAGRMESRGVAGCIQLSDDTRQLLPPEYRVECRGRLQIKGKGDMQTWLLIGRDGSGGELAGAATLDSASGALNDRVFLRCLESEAGRCERSGERVALVVLLPDGGGDDQMARLVALTREVLRESDQVGRLAPNRLGILLYGSSRLQAVEAVRRIVDEASAWLPGGAPMVGAADAQECHYNAQEMLEQAQRQVGVPAAQGAIELE